MKVGPYCQRLLQIGHGGAESGHPLKEYPFQGLQVVNMPGLRGLVLLSKDNVTLKQIVNIFCPTSPNLRLCFIKRAHNKDLLVGL